MTAAERTAFLLRMKTAAAAHKWPGCAAAEAAMETGWGEHIPKNSNNVLGIKAYKGWTGPIVYANGTEQSPNGEWTAEQLDGWCVFASPQECFAEQMKILQEPRYAAAMAATTPENYIMAECRVWSTGILKAEGVLTIWRCHKDLLD